MLYTDLTKKAMAICFRAHGKQKDKGGLPYVFHPFHLAEQMDTEDEICAALLHDVVEDTDWTLEGLAAEGFPPAVTRALALLTHEVGMPYLEYVRRLKDDPIAAKVKLADLRHNSAPGRLPEQEQGSADADADSPSDPKTKPDTPGHKRSAGADIMSGVPQESLQERSRKKPAGDRPPQYAKMSEKDYRRMQKYLRAQAILTGGRADLDRMLLFVEKDGRLSAFLPDGSVPDQDG